MDSISATRERELAGLNEETAPPVASEASAAVEGSGPSESSTPSCVGTTEDEDRVLEHAQALVAVEEMIRSGEAVEVQIMVNAGDDESDCQCLECLLGYNMLRWGEKGYEAVCDESCGLGWNEKSYFD
jgi:hypothetical protein